MRRIPNPVISLSLLFLCLPLRAQEDPPPDQSARAAAMLQSAEEVMAQVEKLRGWKFKRPVRKDVQTVEQLRAYIEKQLFEEEYGEGKLDRTQAWLKALGLLPDGENFRHTVMDVLLSQIGGFYDPKQQAFFMMVEAADYGESAARMLIAHELCHALDDQYVDLQALMEPEDGRELTEDESFAIGGVVEGSATALMLAWMSQAIASGEFDIMEIMEMSRQQADQTEILLSAPPYFTLIAANYFVGRHFITKGEPLLPGMPGGALDTGASILEVAKNPPRSTEQLLHPDKYWDPDQRDEPVRLANEDAIAAQIAVVAGKDIVQTDTLGEMVCALMGLKVDHTLNANLMAQASYWTNRYSRGWGGDRLFLLGERRADGSENVEDAGVIWITAWDTEGDREEFTDAMTRHRGESPGLVVVESGRVAVFGMGSLRSADKAALQRILAACVFTADGQPWSAGG